MNHRFDPTRLRALSFDVFGTVVDWHGSIARELRLLGANKGLGIDAGAFANAWRAGYAPAMDRTRAAGAAWANIDVLHRQILDELLPRFGLDGLDEAERSTLNLVWHRLMPWPDSVGGLNRLRGRYPISTLSNGNVSLLVNMARNAGLPWDCVLSGELIHKYKPDPAVYLMAARLLGVEPGELMLVAAHPSDLRAAKACGLRTGYVPRPAEYGAPEGFAADADAVRDFDVVADDFHHLARLLAA